MQIRRLKNTGALVLALACTVATLDQHPAAAGTLWDFFRNNRAGQREQDMVLNRDRGYGETRVYEERRAVSKPKPLPKVSGPEYYTYKPDPQRLVATASFTDLVVTGAVADASSAPAPVDPAFEQRRFLGKAQVRATAEIAKALETYYGSNQPLLWVTGNGVNDQARAAIAALADAGAVGLDARDYAVAAPSDPLDPLDTAARNRDLMQFELALSARVLAYVQDAVRGRVDPNRISGYHDFKRKTVHLEAVLKIVKASPDVGAYLRSRNPSNANFDALKAELAKLRAEDGSGDAPVVIILDAMLKPGASSPEMANIVAAIQKHGSDTLKVEHSVTLASYMQTPEYTPELVRLVAAFQKEKGLKPDGVIGQATVRAMVGESNAGKIDKLVVAMEQARWLPNDLGSRYVFINQPAFMVYYHNNNREELAMRVVVGSRTNQTYFFQDEIETVEFNPFWGVPQSIIINEMLPKLRRDPGYLDRMGYEVAVNGQAVSSSSVNWNGSTNAISVRQPPSGDNALGELKILFPNSHAIYMHDTPSKSFFKKDMRALSHGCVRLADPRAMAAAVLGTTVADIGKQIAVGRNQAVQVPQKIPVYVSYFTAWPDKNGVVEYFDDVYGRDAYVNKAFQATSETRAAQS